MKLRQLLIFCSVTLLIVTFIGCAGKRVRAPEDPVKKYKQEFLLKYGFFVTNEKPVTYYKDALGVEGKEKNIFNSLKTVEDADKFIEIFWKMRDYDLNTAENEFKEIIDQRIDDINNEVLASDIDIPLTYFSKNGGLRGDLAHVYLLYGVPLSLNKFKLTESATHVELMVWYYFDATGRTLFRFLFYERNGSVKIFKNHWAMPNFEDLFNPLTSPLRDISARPAPGPEDLRELWLDLEREDSDWVFRSALFKFSDYDDVIIEGGDNNKRFGALDPPEPVSLSAIRFKPAVLGQPDDLAGRDFIKNSYASFIPAELQITNDNGRPSFKLVIGYADTDWEIKSDSAETVLNLRMSFQNKKTRAISEFWVSLPISKPRSEVEKKRGSVYMSIPLDSVSNFAKNQTSQSTLGQLVIGLEPGQYILNVDLRHPVTKKFAGGWREEIVIK